MHPLRIFLRPYCCSSTGTCKKLVWSTYNFSWRKSKLRKKHPKASYFLIIILVLSLFIFTIFYSRILKNAINTGASGVPGDVDVVGEEEELLKLTMIRRQQQQHHNNKVLGKLDIIDNIPVLDHTHRGRNGFTMTKLNLDRDNDGDEEQRKEKEKQFQNLNDPYNNRNDSVNGTMVSRLNEQKQRQTYIAKYCSCQKAFSNYPDEEDYGLIPTECHTFQQERHDSFNSSLNNLTNSSNPEENSTTSLIMPHVKNTRMRIHIPWTRSRRNWIFFKTKDVNRSKLLIEWCPTYKAASSLWMSIFGKLAKILTPHTENLIHKGKLTFIKLFKDLRYNIPPNTLNDRKRGILVNKYQMLIVRHPFQRLLSAYRDKLERVKGRDFYHKKYGLKIINGIKYQRKSNSMRSKITSSSSPSKVQIFHDALSMFLGFRNSSTSNKSNMDDTEGETENVPRTPTFNEFIQYLLTTDPRQMDEHWRPIYLDCSPCLYSYQLILKVETMDRDKEVVLDLLAPYYGNRTKLDSELNYLWKNWINKSLSPQNHTLESSTTVNDTSTNSIHSYFNQISKSDLKLLFEIYRPDFELFQYSPDDYIKMGKG